MGNVFLFIVPLLTSFYYCYSITVVPISPPLLSSTQPTHRSYSHSLGGVSFLKQDQTKGKDRSGIEICINEILKKCKKN